MKQCFSTSLSVPFPAMGMGLMGNAATVAWPLKSCTQNTDCDAGQECTSSSGLGLSDAIIGIKWDPFDELLNKATPSTCSSSKETENQGIAKILEYFTGKEVPSNKFEFCIPKFSQPDFGEVYLLEEVQGTTKIKVVGLAAYDGVLPGVNDQPSVVFAFPPAESEAYTWPQKTERRVEWVSFNLEGKVSLKLMRSGEAKVTLEDLDNDMNEAYEMGADVDIAPGYYYELCASNGLCFQSGKFSVVAEVKDRPKPKKATQVFAGSADILEDPEAKGVFKAATKTNLATVLRVSTHRIEIKDISAATRRSQGIKVEYLIHPDDTGKDNTSVEDLEERANSDAVQSAVVAGQASYATSAQTNNPNVNKIATDDSYSDVDQAKKKLQEVENANAVLVIVAATLGGVFGCCCLGLGGGVVFMMLRKRKAVGGDMEAGQKSVAQPVLQTYLAAPAPQPIMQQQQQVPAAIFCAACGTRNESGKFCEKCGSPL